MQRDPFGTWTRARKVRWLLLGFVLCFLFAPRFVSALVPQHMQLIDFFQEWSSAKNVVNGLPTYAPLELTVERYLGVKKPPDVEWYWDVNVHPPTSVLLALPVQGLDFATAFKCWGIASLMALAVAMAMIVWQLRIRFAIWNLLPIVSLGFICDPLFQQVVQGQLNLFLLLTIVGVWVADRNDRPVTAGGLLAVAAAVKLFPGFLGLYFLLQRKWRALAASAVAFVAITLATAAITGIETYTTYVEDILPRAADWKSTWNNASLAGFWHKLFDPGSRADRFVAPLELPRVALIGTMLSCAAVVGWWGVATWRANSRRQRDHAFGLGIVAMLLVSPVTWEHYFLLLLLPLALVWVDLPPGRAVRWLLAGIVGVLFLPIIMLCNVFLPGGFFDGQASLTATLTLLSMQLYALCGLFVLGMIVLLRIRREETKSLDVAPVERVQREPAEAIPSA